jgi:hypothetical protein
MLAFLLVAVAGLNPPALPPRTEPDAWSRLPRENPPLPRWARVLVGPLPKTTARLLELENLHRAENPLGAVLAGKVHWAVADALGSSPGRATADADLKRAGAGRTPDTAAEKLAVAFARRLTLEGHAITDREFAAVLQAFGPEKTTALVHTIAYANFHNRLVLGLGAVGDPVPPLAVKFDADGLARVPVPPRPPWDDLKTVTARGLSVRVEWSKADADQLARTVELQKERPLRIPLPDPERLAGLVGREKEQAERIIWMTVSMGYQPRLTRAWFAALNAFYEEAQPDRVFTNSTFWVVTRTNDCFY